MSDKPLISIIIPVFNAELFLEETLNSVEKQTYENWECIIINDGSTDSTLSIAKQWAEKNPKIKVFDKKNEGHSQTRNFGIQQAQSDYIAFLDSDDLWLPHHLEMLITNLLQNNTDLVFSYAYRIENEKTTNIPALKKANEEKILGLQQGKIAIENFLQFNKISTPFCLVKREILIQNQCFSYHKNGEDYHTWLKILLNGGIFYSIDQATGYIRITENSTSDTDRNCTREIMEILSLLRKEIEYWGINYHQYFNLWCRRFLLLKDDKEHYIDALKYINGIDRQYFSTLKNIAPFLPKKLLKILYFLRLKYLYF